MFCSNGECVVCGDGECIHEECIHEECDDATGGGAPKLEFVGFTGKKISLKNNH